MLLCFFQSLVCFLEDSADLAFVKTSMATVLQMNTKLALEGIFDQIMGEDEAIRQKGMEYVCGTLMSMKHKLFDSRLENEECLLLLIKKVLFFAYIVCSYLNAMSLCWVSNPV